MAKTKLTSALRDAVTIFRRLQLPPDFVLPEEDPESRELKGKWASCFEPLRQVPGFHLIMCGRMVEDPFEAIFMISVLSPEALETLLETQQYKDCFAALGLEQPPPHFTTVDAISMVDLKPPRVTLITMSCAYPATPEQREIFKNRVGGVPIPKRFYEGHSAGPGWTRILMPRGARSWVREPQKLLDGREVENALTFQPWLRQEMEEVAVGEELELRERWKSAVVSRLGLLAISVDRYDFYPIE